MVVPSLPTTPSQEIEEILATNCPQEWKMSQESIASGVYIYVVTGGGGRKSTGKIGIVK